MNRVNIAVVGATGAVGAELIALLEQRGFPAGEVRLLASARSAGTQLSVLGKDVTVQELTEDSFAGIDIAFFSAGGSISERFAPAAVDAGAVVVDNSSAFRLVDDVPLVVPEVNPEAMKTHRGIIANPNCSTIIMLVALNPLHRAAGIRRIVVSTYQAVSGAGAAAMEELERQTRAYAAEEPLEARLLPVASGAVHYPILFNVIPQVDGFDEADYTREEWKMVRESQKVWGDPNIGITATTVRVPVLRSHGESINVEFERPLSVEEARRILAAAPGVAVEDEPGSQRYPMPTEATGRDEVLVGRLRRDDTVSHGLNLWVVGDQIRKGAALNAVQIAELLLD